jgi:hypothetical protein
MGTVLPPQTGLTVGGVYYRYTMNKDPNADAQVHIQNEDAVNGGLLYRNTDEWSGLPGNTIVNKFLLPDIPAQYFGDGSIEVEGEGTVSDPSIIYSYTYDTCADPMADPSCPGYESAYYQFLLDSGLLNPEPIQVNDPLDDENVQEVLDQEVRLKDEEEQEEEEQEEEIDMEEALAVAENAIAMGDAAAQNAMFAALSFVPAFSSYLETNIPGGVYEDTIELQDAELPDNRNALRSNLIQQQLHEEMVDSQYRLGDEARNE